MNTFFRHLAVAAFSILPLAGFAQDPPIEVDRDAVLKLIEQLSSRSFQVREDAEKGLWALGPAIEPILVEKLDDADIEAKQRIGNIRRNFDFGLTPDLPAEVQELVAKALRSGDPNQRIQAIAALAQQGRAKAAANILKRINDPRQRHAFYLQLINSLSQRSGSKQLDDFHLKLLELALDEPAPYQVQIFQSLVRSIYFRKRDDEDWLKRLAETLAKCPAEARYSLVMGYSFEQSVLNKLTSQDLLPLWINMVATEPDWSGRRRLIAKVMGGTIPAWLNGANRFRGKPGDPKPQFDLKQLFDDLSDDGRLALLDYAANVPAALGIVHNELGDEYLMKVCSAAKNAAMRGQLQGQLASLENWPKSGKEEYKILSLVDREQDAEARQHLITGFLSGLSSQSRRIRAAPQQLIDGLWEKLTTDKEEAWQLVAILNTYSAAHLFADKHSKETIERLFRLTAMASQLELIQLIHTPTRNQYFANELAKHGLALDLLKTVQRVRQPNLGQQIGFLLASPTYTEAYNSKELRQALIDFCLDEKTIQWRYYMAGGIIRNRSLLTQLLSDGHFETIAQSLIVGTDGRTQQGASYANLLGSFYASNATVRHLVQSGNVKNLLALKEAGAPATIVDTVLGQIVRSEAAVSAIFENGQWEKLNEALDAIENDSQRVMAKRNLMSRKAFAENLAEHRLLVPSLHQFSKDKAWVTGRLHLQLINNLSFDQTRNEPELAFEFWKFASELPENARNSCVETLLASRWFVPLLIENEQLAPVWDALKETYGSDRLYLMVSSLAQGRNSLSYFEDGQLGALLQLGELLDPSRVAEFYRSLGSSGYVQTWLATDGKPASLIDAIQQIQPGSKRGEFLFAFFTSGVLRRVQKDSDLALRLAEFLGKQPKDQATLISLAVLSQDAFGSVFAEQDLSNCLRGDLSQAIQTAANDQTWARRVSHWANLIGNLKPQDAKQEQALAAELWKQVSDEGIYNASIAKAMITTPWFVEQILQQNQLPAVLEVLKKHDRPYNISMLLRNGCRARQSDQSGISRSTCRSPLQT